MFKMGYLESLLGYTVFLLSVLEILPCDAYERRESSWYISWYIWVVIFAIATCCCGAAGSYYRRKMLERANSGQRENRAYLNPAYPTVYNGMQQAPAPASPAQPGLYAPQAPPAYNSVNTISAYQPGGDATTKKDLAPPPSYAEVCETSNTSPKAETSQANQAVQNS